ncbi:MAG: NADH:ubiquinone oxidoreductase [Burkholderiaceae bacterium]|nr:hydrogenase [Desulfobacterales bacterium]MDP3139723.1 NADH:ubiquinone oxidoreductase [Burkholderiaceae bacterium]
MLKSIAVRVSQGTQYIEDPRRANPAGFRGLPVIGADDCAQECQACVTACPTQAITLDPIQIDLGRCIMCADCAPACPTQKLSYSSQFQIASTDRAGLVISESRRIPDPIAASAALHKLFGRSMKLRSVSAGGCNGCELEVGALTNVNFDITRYGIDIVASPRHADGLVLTGPITRNMAQSLQLCWEAMPEPKIVIAVGACAISGGLFEDSAAIERSFLDRFKPTLYVPGCPAHPLSLVCGILDLLGIAS